MSSKQTYTSSPFITYGQITTGNVSNQIYEVLGAAAYDRRIYGIGVTLNDGSTHSQVRFYINNGSNNFQLNLNSITANSGFSTAQGVYDLFGASTISAYFGKQFDQIAVPYFNLPAGWSFGASSFLTLGAGENLGFWFTGERYAAYNLNLTSNEFSQNVSFNNADGTSVKTIVSSSAYDRRIYAISAFSSDSTARNLILNLNDGTTSRTIGTISVTANAGNTTSVSALDIIAHANVYPIVAKQYDMSGQPFFHLPAGWSIEGNFSVSITAGTNIKFISNGEVYE